MLPPSSTQFFPLTQRSPFFRFPQITRLNARLAVHLVISLVSHLATRLTCASLLLATPLAHAQGVWATDPTSHCQGWNPYPAPEETVQWKGPCLDGKIHGQGVWSYVTPSKRQDETGFFWRGMLVGRFERKATDANGHLIATSGGFSPIQTVMNEFYMRHDAGPQGAPSGYRVRYYTDRRLSGVYQQDMSDNRERVAYSVDGDPTEAKNRFNVVYLARFNPATGAWSDIPETADRDKQGLHAYIVITRQGKTDSAQEWRCAGDSYEACVPLFEQKLTAAGYASWPRQRMNMIDTLWQQHETEFKQQMAAQAEHQRLLTQGTADKLYTYASRMEQAQDYANALDALRAIIERFPQSRFFDPAANRLPVVQDKLTQQQYQQYQQERQQARDQQQQAMQQHREQAQTQHLAERKKHYAACMADYDSCNTNCLASGGTALALGLAGLANPNAVNINGLNQINQRTQNNCQRCEALKAQCAAYAD